MNRAIKEVANNQKIKRIGEQLWLFNPVSEFWYSLRYMKDVFSTLIQGTASYVFDLWIFEIISKRQQITATFHDEGVWELKPENKELVENILKNAIDKVNETLKLNKLLEIDIQFGKNYGEIH